MSGAAALTALGLRAGVWQAIVVSPDPPDLAVTHRGEALEGVTLTPEADAGGQWRLHVPIPAERISDGVQSFVVVDRRTGQDLGGFAISAGEALDGDLAADIALLRAELDLLKEAFRRHCRDTGGA